MSLWNRITKRYSMGMTKPEAITLHWTGNHVEIEDVTTECSFCGYPPIVLLKWAYDRTHYSVPACERHYDRFMENEYMTYAGKRWRLCKR